MASPADLIQSKIAELEEQAAMDELIRAAELRRNTTPQKEVQACIGNVEGTPQRLSALQDLFVAQAEELRKLDEALASERAVRIRNQGALATASEELSRTRNQLTTLQNLCRELRTQNTTILQSQSEAAQTQAKLHSDMHSKFQATLDGITEQMDQHTKEREELATENGELREKLTTLIALFDEREGAFKETSERMTEELARLQKLNETHEAIAQQERLRADAFKSEAEKMIESESALREQVDLYSKRFAEFDETINKSSEVFVTYRQRIEQLTQQVATGEVEKKLLERRAAQADLAAIKSAEEAVKAERRATAMGDLCRRLRAELAASAPGGPAATDAPEPADGEPAAGGEAADGDNDNDGDNADEEEQ